MVFKGDIEKARKHYNGQPSVKALQGMVGLWSTPDVFMVSRAEYIQRARDSACVPYALVYKGEWASKGRMGWFGISDESTPEHEWNRLVNEMLGTLPDDTPLTIVDCHI